MPEICRFYGIVIKLFFRDHPPPHFHVEYGEHRALYDIDTLEMSKDRCLVRRINSLLNGQ